MYMVLVGMKSRGNEQFSLTGLGYTNIRKYQYVMKVNLDNDPLFAFVWQHVFQQDTSV